MKAGLGPTSLVLQAWCEASPDSILGDGDVDGSEEDVSNMWGMDDSSSIIRVRQKYCRRTVHVFKSAGGVFSAQIFVMSRNDLRRRMQPINYTLAQSKGVHMHCKNINTMK